MGTASAYAAFAGDQPLKPFTLERREVYPHDVQLEILFCGVCHSDIHTARGEWPGTVYPVVPGHEIAGRVTAVGSEVKRFKVGDLAAVGCMVDSCRVCGSCSRGLEQYCEKGETVFTYNSPDRHSAGKPTYGGYSTHMVVDENFVLRVSPKLDLAGAAPLLCAGITTYSPLKHWKAGPGKRVGVVGLGGLGHMAVKFSAALGAQTVVFTTSKSKVEDAHRLGADEVIISSDEGALQRNLHSFDFILNTVSASHNLDTYIQLLKLDGAMCLVGAPQYPHPSPSIMNLIRRRVQIGGSLIGGIKETQEMLDFCAERGIVSDIELIAAHDINTAYERMLKSDVKYRFVIDISSMRKG